MTSIKGFPVQIRFKNKKRGRPSKYEIYLSNVMSEQFESPQYQEALRNFQNDLIIYGTASVDLKAWNSLII